MTNAARVQRLQRAGGPDMSANGPQDVHAHLVFRVHYDAVESGWTRDAVTACYSVDFNYYSLATGPTRVDCPANASPIIPPPTCPVEIPDNFDQPLHRAHWPHCPHSPPRRMRTPRWRG